MSFQIYQSSAGSGKTFTLVKEYLKIVIRNPEKFRHVLAVTFTNKAANEMKERVLKKLKVLSDPNKQQKLSDDPMLESLLEETGLDNNTIAGRAGMVLKLILHNYSEFSVGTIDSFMYRVIRTFAYDLQIPLNFEVELDSNRFTQQAIDMLISRVGHERELTQALLKFVESRTEAESSWRIEKDLQTFADIMLKDESFPYLDRLKNLEVNDIIKMDRKMNDYRFLFRESLSKPASEAMEMIEEQGLDAGAFYQGGKGVYGYLQKLRAKDYRSVQPNNYIKETLSSGHWKSSSLNENESAKLDSIEDELQRILNRIQGLLDESYKDYILFEILRKHIFPIAVLNEIQKVIEGFRETDNIIHISEFNRRIAEIVYTEPVPFIYERLGERYQHYLVDEFQDTSILQWHNLIPLFENSLGHGNLNMVVGDVKQAIYRWRGGDARQLMDLPRICGSEEDEVLRQRELVLSGHANMKRLNKNYRSRRKIVEFNNGFFEFAASRLPSNIQAAFANIKQEWDHEKDGGLINFHFFDSENTPAYEEDIKQDIEHTIKQLTGEGFRHRDIAILCRKNKEASLIAGYLLERGINVISAESLLLSSSPNVNFLIACLSILNNPKDKISLTEITRYLISTGKTNEKDLNKVLTGQLSETNEIIPVIGIPWQKLLNMPLYEMAEELIRFFKLGRPYDPYLQFFLDAIISFTNRNHGSLSEFLEWWQENKEKLSIVLSEGQEAVRILTIHKAKGLEFPVVLYPFADEKFIDSLKKRIWVDFIHEELPALKASLVDTSQKLQDTVFEKEYREEMEQAEFDTINLLYVAMTRPTDRLYLMSHLPSIPKDGIEKNIAQLFVSYLKKLELWQDGKYIYECGDGDIYPDQERDRPADSFKLDNMVSVPWRDRLLLSTNAPQVWNLESPGKNRDWGNLIHFLLAKIRYQDEVESQVELAQVQGLIDSKDVGLITGMIETILKHPILAPYYSKEWKVRNEADIIDGGKAYRPDRLAFRNRDVVVIDYKTGRKEAKHTDQVNLYAKKLTQISYNVRGKYLVYIGEAIKVEEV